MAESADEPTLAEDRARAEVYALISRLFYAPPDAALLQCIAWASAEAPENGDTSGEYGEALEALRRAARSADPDALRQEFDDTFVGAGRALVTPYTSGYSLPHAPDRHLVALREQLALFGLERRHAVFEMEDHVAAVCDIMRWLITRERPLHEQRAFFHAFVYSGVGTFCSAIEASASTSFYCAIARLTRAFLEIENEALALE